MNDVLYVLCRHCASIMQGWIPLPSTCISKDLGKSLYQTRKELKRLKEQGLVQSDRYCVVDEDRNYLISGFQITDKGKDTPEYKKAWAEEREICKEAFGIDIGEADYDPYKEIFGDDFCSYGEMRAAE